MTFNWEELPMVILGPAILINSQMNEILAICQHPLQLVPGPCMRLRDFKQEKEWARLGRRHDGGLVVPRSCCRNRITCGRTADLLLATNVAG